MKSYRSLASVLALAISTCFISAEVSAVQYKPADGITGATGSAMPVNPWSFHWTGPGCSSGTITTLNSQYTAIPSFHGFHGNQQPSGPLPIVIGPVGGGAGSANGLSVPAGTLLLHPGPRGECAIVRYTAPAGGVSNYSASFYSAYINKTTACGNGAQPRVGKGNNPSTTPIFGNPWLQAVGTGNTVVMTPGTLNPGEFIDFAVGSNGTDFQCDSTILDVTIDGPPVIPKVDYGFTPLPLQNPECGPWQICFDVNVPGVPGSALMGSAQLQLSILQNGNLVQTLPSPTFNADTKKWCFTIPQNAGYLNPALGGFDYYVTGQFLTPATATSPGQPLPPKVVGSRPHGMMQGVNNDIKLCGTTSNANCCPKYLEINKLTPMFQDSGGTDGTAQTEFFQHTSPAHTALVTAINAHLALLKVSGCPNAAFIRLTFTKYDTNSTNFPTALPASLPGPWTAGPSFSITYNGSTFNGTGSFPMANSPNYMAFVASAQLLNQQGQPITCGDFNPDCFKVLRTATINYANSFKTSGPAGLPQSPKRADF